MDTVKSKKGRKKALLFIALFSMIFGVAFLIGQKVSEKQSVVVGASTMKNDKEAVSQKQGEKNDSTEKQGIQKEGILGEVKDKDKDKDKETKNTVENQRELNVEHKGNSITNPYAEDGNKIAYLTFDDGPTANITSNILDILKKENIKATFFVVGKMAANNSELLKREKAEGHVIGNHSYSHNYTYLYENPQNFIEDMEKSEAVISSIIGQHNEKLIRFPGGSFGKSREAYRQAAQKKGDVFVDWNALNGDAEAVNVPVHKLIARLKETSTGKSHIVVLMHDAPGKETTVQALPEIIEYLKSQNYIFKTL